MQSVEYVLKDMCRLAKPGVPCENDLVMYTVPLIIQTETALLQHGFKTTTATGTITIATITTEGSCTMNVIYDCCWDGSTGV